MNSANRRGGEHEPCQPELAGQHPARQPPNRPAADNGDIHTTAIATKVSATTQPAGAAHTLPQGHPIVPSCKKRGALLLQGFVDRCGSCDTAHPLIALLLQNHLLCSFFLVISTKILYWNTIVFVPQSFNTLEAWAFAAARSCKRPQRRRQRASCSPAHACTGCVCQQDVHDHMHKV